MSSSRLRPEYDLIENTVYLSHLVADIEKATDYSDDILQEVMQADYYVNRLKRRGTNKDFEARLDELSSIFQGVLDSADSKRILTLHEGKVDDTPNEDMKYEDSGIDEPITLFKWIFSVLGFLLSMGLLWGVLFADSNPIELVYNKLAVQVNKVYADLTGNDSEDLLHIWSDDENDIRLPLGENSDKQEEVVNE